jgi:hypothetical protein
VKAKAMTKLYLTTILTVATLGAACGNYSNADLDFQVVLPEREDLNAKLPQQYALVDASAAEYLTTTRNVAIVFNTFIDDVTQLIDHVRAYPANVRQGEVRIWGPFPHEKSPAWELRLQITRGRDPGASAGFRFSYALEFHRTGTAAPWQSILTGTFAPGGGAGRGSGELELDLAPARMAGFPVAEFKELVALRVRYQRMTFPHTVEMNIENMEAAETPRATVIYTEEASGAGAMSFVVRVRDNMLVQALGIKTRWQPDGKGRGDARVVEGLGGLGANLPPIATDCWGADGHATYSLRDFAPRHVEGDPASCVFPAAAP